jgi:hypothetical protein
MKDIDEIEAKIEELVERFKQYIETTPSAKEYIYGNPEHLEVFRCLGSSLVECEIA